jgi:hypothetical protein
MLAFYSVFSFAQEKTVSGVVTANRMMTMPGVSSIRSTTKGLN